MSGIRVKLGVLSLLLGVGSALAHAELKSVSPERDAVLGEAPGEVVLEFTEPAEVRFSTFKVYALDADVDLSAENATQRLNGLAGQLVGEVLTTREDTGARVDTGVTPAGGQSESVTLALPEELPAGPYVVMWRVLSVDTHTTQGFYVFQYQPEGSS